MIHHIVQFEWLPGTTAEQIAKAEAGLQSMRAQIAEIRDIRFGPNLVEESVPYTHVLIVVCDDMHAVRRYIAHPVHKQVVAECTKPIIRSRLAADVEVGAAPIPDGR